MATQKCPRCSSDRIRHGYRPTSIFKKITFRYNLLCDACNWEFVGFAIPGTVSSKSRKKKSSDYSDNKAQTVIAPVMSKLIQFEKNSKTDELVAPLKNIQTEKLVAPIESTSDKEIIVSPIENASDKEVVVASIEVVAEEPFEVEASSESGETEEAIETKAPSVKRVKVKKKKRVKIRL